MYYYMVESLREKEKEAKQRVVSMSGKYIKAMDGPKELKDEKTRTAAKRVVGHCHHSRRPAIET